ncbi:MAG: type II toxin-antitoxin system toxin DNA ADP-ribosyl transferase DarT [Solirubrobacterales bacterium]
MTPRPPPTLLYHFTHMENLPSIVAGGLLCEAAGTARSSVEVGNRRIKDQRRRRPVPVEPGGAVSDYVPFYFAPRSPMLYAINGGQVPEYTDGQDPLLYLVTSVERLVELGLALVFTDRNATLGFARFSAGLDELDGLVDWTLMGCEVLVQHPRRP